MRKFFLLSVMACLSICCMAQNDTIKVEVQTDTIRVGGMIIIKGMETNEGHKSESKNVKVVMGNDICNSNQKLHTDWLLLDLGFNNYNDQTNYASAEAQAFAPGGTEDWFKLRNGKSVNVNIWFFMQQLRLTKNNILSLKYGLGMELFNFRYEEPLRFTSNPVTAYMDNANNYTKNKLAANYITIPAMLHINFTPNKPSGRYMCSRAFGLSLGMSAGYLYNSHQKIIMNGDKSKIRNDFELRKWKISYIGEFQLGPITLFGSYATQSMFTEGLKQTPYTVGIRL